MLGKSPQPTLLIFSLVIVWVWRWNRLPPPEAMRSIVFIFSETFDIVWWLCVLLFDCKSISGNYGVDFVHLRQRTHYHHLMVVVAAYLFLLWPYVATSHHGRCLCACVFMFEVACALFGQEPSPPPLEMLATAACRHGPPPITTTRGDSGWC